MQNGGLQVQKLCCRCLRLGVWAVLIKRSEPAVAFIFPLRCKLFETVTSMCAAAHPLLNLSLSLQPSLLFVLNGTLRLC